MNKIYSIFTIAIAALSLGSCNLLDVNNPSAIYGSGYWKTKGEVASYLTGTYTVFRSCCNSLEFFEARGDEFIGGLEGSGSNQWAQNLTANNGISWADYYQVIQHCNMILENIDNVTYTLESEKNDIKAQCYTMRAYMHFCLTRLWGDVPIQTVATVGSSKELPERSSCEEVMTCILSDLDTALGLFSTDEWNNGKSRANKRGAYALKADVLLWKAKVLGGDEKDLEAVIDCADLAAKGSSLEKNFADIYNTKNRNGKEVIWSIHFGYPEIDANYTHFLTLRDVFVEKAVNKDLVPYAKSGARSSYFPSPQIRRIFDAYQGDVRKTNAYIDAVDASGSVLGVSQTKMVGTKTETNVIYDDDIVLYRHAEMLLFKAEALAALNRVPEAVVELNKVRERAGIGAYTGSTDKVAFERELLDERAREFWLENKRWPDLLRFHYEGVIDVYDKVPNLKARKDADIIVPLYFAVPLSELSLNHKLVQTEGYDEIL